MYKVLLVDDEPFIVDGMKLVINWEELGLEIAGEAFNGDAALEFLEHNKVHIIITDIKMPGMNGIDLIKYSKSNYPGIKIIILSGYDDFEYVKQASKYGIENYLLKPVNEEELISTLLHTTNKLESDFKMSIQQRKDANILRDNMLLRWVSGTISLDELERRVELLDLKIHDSFYLVCIIREMHTENTSTGVNELVKYPDLKRFAITNICSDVIDVSSVYFFSNLEGDVVLLFHSDGSTADYNDIIVKLKKCMEFINQYIKLDVYIVVGSVQSSYEKVCTSYKDAVKLMEYCLIMPPNMIIEFSNTQMEISRLNNEFSINLDMVRKLVIEKDIDNAILNIEEIYHKLKSYKNLSPLFLKSTTIQIIFIILSTIGMSSNSAGSFIDEAGNVFLRASEMKSIQEHCEWVKTVAKDAILFLLSVDRNYSPVIKNVIKYINANFDKEIALKSISNSLNMNAVYLGQLFKTETGELFSNYLNHIRIEEAKKLLLNTRLYIVDIGLKAGYSNNNHFLATFKKIVGLSPTEFKRINKL